MKERFDRAANRVGYWIGIANLALGIANIFAEPSISMATILAIIGGTICILSHYHVRDQLAMKAPRPTESLAHPAPRGRSSANS